MGANDGQVIGTTKIVDRGPDQTCFNVVLMADGYTAAQQNDFNGDCATFVQAFNNLAPFNDCGAGVNFHRINISSTDQGADDPATCGGPGTSVNTYLDSSFCTGNPAIRRLMHYNQALALQVLNQQVPAWHQALILVNSPEFGGAGGTVAIVSTGSNNWTGVAMHEFGHAAFGLADEYEYWAGCGVDGPAQNHHSAVEPVQPNVTTKSQRDQIKWRSLILPTTAVPTTANANCGVCDPQPSPVPAGTVGAFEGAHYCHCGAYRPAFDCMMRTLSPFCPVCQAVIRQRLAPFAQQADLAITPWGYAQTPPAQPYWQTPDIWGSPVRGQAVNDLHIRVRNAGSQPSPAFNVRVSFVPFTTLIDLANEVLIGVFPRPALAAGGVDPFVVNWDLTPPALPAQYANFDHFCVIVQIQTAECNTTNNQAQNNFCNVPVTPGGPPPAPLMFEIANPWREEAIAWLEIQSDDRRLKLKAVDFDPGHILLKGGERRAVQVALDLAESARSWKASFQITQRLRVKGSDEGQTVGGIGGTVSWRATRRVRRTG